MSVSNKPMLKVIVPIKKEGGGTHWMRAGTAFYNQDNSINVYLDAVPFKFEGRLVLREFDADELRSRDARRAASAAVPNVAPSGDLPF